MKAKDSGQRVPYDILVCPECKKRIVYEDDCCLCTNDDCGIRYPVIAGRPVLICEEKSCYQKPGDQRKKIDFDDRENKWRIAIRRIIPTMSITMKSRRNFTVLRDRLLDRAKYPRCLVIGCGDGGVDIDKLTDDPRIDFVNLDVVPTKITDIVADAHDLPFKSESLNGVVLQAVLEHVVYPVRVMSEVYRVLQPKGLVYAEVPFMQQVHMAPNDFLRFTHFGLKNLFRDFEQHDSGVLCGPGMSLAWSYRYFLMSFFDNSALKQSASVFARLTGFYLKYFDYFLVRKSSAFDAASALYFLGEKR